MKLNEKNLSRQYRQAIKNLPEDKRDEILKVLLEGQDDSELGIVQVEKGSKIKKINAGLKEITTSDYKRFYWKDQYVGFIDWTDEWEYVFINKFLTSNYNTTNDEDVYEELKEEYMLMDKVERKWLWTTILLKFINYLKRRGYKWFILISSAWSIKFYEKVFDLFEEEKIISYFSNEIKWEDNKEFVINILS